MARVSIIKFGSTLVATLNDDLTDDDALGLQENLNATIERTQAEALLIDVTPVETIDSFLGRLLHEIAMGARLLGTRTVVVGIQPAVAMTLVELGLELRGVSTALTVERGLQLLSRGLGRRD